MYQSTDKWDIDKYTHDRITRVIGAKATVERFATSCNTMARKFYLKFPTGWQCRYRFFCTKAGQQGGLQGGNKVHKALTRKR